jgi:beta-mannosidase
MEKKEKIPLDGEWDFCYVENRHFRGDVSSAEAIEKTGWNKIKGIVPGNFELDFQRAGIIGDPYFGTNAIENQKYENLHLIYFRKFRLDFEPDSLTILHFEGIDTIADIYVNGRLIGQTDNMLIPFDFAGANLRRGENEIVVHIKPTVIEARKYEVPVSCHAQSGGYDTLFIRKAPHMDGWDIMPRMISGGIWRTCYIEQKKPNRIDDIFCYVLDMDAAKGYAQLSFFYNITVTEDDITGYQLEISGECGDSRFTCRRERLRHTAGKLGAYVGDAKFWWPRNYGDPNLYNIKAILYYRGEPVSEYKTRIGIRTIRLDRTSVIDGNSGEFCFYINGKKIFWLGTNWVPVDALHSRDVERLPQILPMLTDIGCNSVRCWGGNVYEHDIFYDFCDENGIMVWQDFSHACAINPQTDEYCDRFKHEVEVIVKRLRNRASVVIWAGDNEVDACYHWSGPKLHRDPNGNRLTREVIPSVLALHDFTRPYLPSSPYIDEDAFRSGKPTSEEHLWGPRDYFKGKFYKGSVCSFASETGYHGCPSPESLRKFIREDQLWHWRSAPDSDLPKPDWTAHASCDAIDGSDWNYTRIRLMSNQVKTLFTNFREDEAGQGLERFALASQISQAEAMKYFIERFRVTKWRRTGIIWWNLIDGCPQISDAVVDYYGVKKLAYDYIKRSQSPICMIFNEPVGSIEPDTFYPAKSGGRLPLHVVSDLQKDVVVRYSVTDLTAGITLLESECIAKANESTVVWYRDIPSGEKHFYYIEWEYEDGGRIKGQNHYMSNIIDIDFNEYVGYVKRCAFLK